MSEDVNLYDDPNRYANEGKLLVGETLKFYGYQEFELGRDFIKVLPSDPKLRRKQDLVRPIVESEWFDEKSILDLGANSAFFCFYSLLNGSNRADAVEIDKKYVGMVNSAINHYDINNMEMHDINVMDYHKKADLVVAYALIHWIYSCTSDYGSLTQAVAKLADLANEVLIIEWVDPQDDAIKFFNHLDFNKSIINEPYDLEHFEKALSKSFETWELLGDVKATRKVYACYKSEAIKNEIKKREEDRNNNDPDQAHRFLQKTLAGILGDIKNIDQDMTLLFYPDLLQNMKIDNYINETDILVSNQFIVDIETICEMTTLENGNKYIELDLGKLNYRINLFTIENFPEKVSKYFKNSVQQSGEFKALNRKASADFILFKMLYHYGATDNSLNMLYNIFNPDQNVVSISSDLNYYSNLIFENSLKIKESNKFLTDKSFDFVYSLVNCVSARILSVTRERIFISRVYKLEDRYVKQANHGIAEDEYNFLKQLSKYNCFPNVNNLQQKENSHYFEVEAIDGTTITDDKEFHKLYTYLERKEFVTGLLDILEILEKERIEHRDINTNNIFVRDKKPVLFDFGWAKTKGEDAFTPSGLNGENSTPTGELNDVYAVAKTLEDIKFTGFDDLIKEMKSDWNKPISEYRKYLEPKSEFSKDLPQLIKHLKQHNYEEALVLSQKLMENLPRNTINNSNLHYSKALCLYKLGRYEEAEEAVYAEVIINPGFEEAHELRAAIEDAMGGSTDMSYEQAKPEQTNERESEQDYEVTIIIPCFNKVELTKQCLESIFEITGQDVKYEVLLVDNASEDATEELCIQYSEALPNFRYIRNDENMGFAIACNQGIDARKGKHALLLNNDTVVTEGWLKEMLITLNKEEKCGIVGSCLLYPDSELIQHCGVYIGQHQNGFAFPFHFNLYAKLSETPEAKEVRKLRAVTGACFLINEELINDIGGLDDGYINGYEDIDYCLMAENAGWNIYYCGKSLLFHYESMSQSRHKFDNENLVRFVRKWEDKASYELNYEETSKEIAENNQRYKEINDGLEYDYKQVRREILGKGKGEIEFSIIIPVHSDADYTVKCLQYIHSQTYLHNIEIILIDNDSDSRTKQLISNLGDFAKVIVNEKNESYSKANNQGAEIATGKYLVFMNNDIETKTGWMESLETVFDNNPEIAIQGAKLTYPDNRIQHAGIVWGPVPELNNINLHYHVHLLKDEDDPAVNIAKEYQMVTGALLTIRREVFEEVGGFDEQYYFGHEDLDLCMKVRDAGYKVWYNPKVSATHHESITKKKVGMDKFERYFKNEDSYDKANHEYFLSKWKDKLVVDSVVQTTTKQQDINVDSDKKRILFTMYGWNEVGGGTTFPKSVAKGLVLKGYEVYVIYATGKHPHNDEPYFVEESNDSGVNLIGIYNRPAKFLDYERPEREVKDEKIVEIYEQYLDKIDPDIVNFHNFIGLSFGIVKPTTERAIKTIFTPYNYHPIDPKLYMFTDDLKKWGNTEFFTYSDVPDIDRKHDLYEERINVARDSVNACDMVLAVSDRQKEIYEEFGIYKELIYKVNQIHDNLDVISKRSSREVHKPIKIGFIGAVIPQKGIQSLIAACSQIDRQDLELHIYGYCNDEYRELLQSIKTECEIVFHGAYDKNQLNDIANKLDLMVVPSIWEDCAPFVVQESLAMGLPVIGSDLGGISDFVEDGYNGIIYDHSNSIELRDILLDMIKNPDLLTELQENACVPVSFNDYLTHLTDIYEKLIGNAPLKREEIEFDFKSMLKGIELKDELEEEASVGAKRMVINLSGYSSAGTRNLYNKNEDQSLFNKETQRIDLEDSSLQSLELENLLEYLETDEVAKLLKEAKRVLAGNAKLEISVLDVATISSSLSTGDISLNDYNNMMFGAANHRIKNSFDSASLNALLKANKFENIEIKKTKDDSTAIGKPLITGIGYKPVNAAEQSDNGYTYSKDYRPQLNIVWEGTQFVHHSLALINREQCSNIIDAEVADLTIVPYEPEKFNPKGNDKYEKLYWHDIRVKDINKEKEKLPYVWIRHQWPPKNEAPKGSRWIINQPWEFSALTTDLKDAFQNADEVWTPTNWCRNVYINSGIEPDKVQVIPNGIDPSLFTPKGKQYPLKSNKKIKFLFVGGTIYRKGIDILLDSYVSTFTKHDDVCLVIKDMGGDTFYKGQTAKEYINKLKLIDDTPEIDYIDEMLPEEDIAALYRACDVFVSPYRGEGFSLPTLEAMACGLPVIVTEGGATDDFVDENVGWKIKADPKSIGTSMGEKTFVHEAYLLEPDQEDLSTKLRHAYDSSTSLISVGLIASHRARTVFTWRNATIKTLKRLDYLYDTEMTTPAMLKLEKLEDDYILLGEAEIAFNNFEYDKAIQLYKQVVESGNLEDEYEALALKETVLIMLNTGNYDLAEQFLESFNPDDVDYQYLSAKTKAYKGNLEDCLDEMTNIMNNWQKIKHDSQISLTLDHVLSFVGEIMSAMGDDESALKVYQASLEINKLNIDSLFGIGEIMIKGEQYDVGKEYLQQVLAVYPDHQDAIELLNSLEEV